MVNLNISNMTSPVISNQEIIKAIVPPEIISKINFLTTILKAIGIVIIIYIVLLIINHILTMIRNRRITKMYHKINEIDQKIDTLLSRIKDKSKSKEIKDKKEKK